MRIEKQELSNYTFGELGELVWKIWQEISRRNVNGANFYQGYFRETAKICYGLDLPANNDLFYNL